MLCCALHVSVPSWLQDACRHYIHSRAACRAVSSRQLIPGDVIVVLPGKATCDMVLLQGNCLVEESNLSGEVIAAHQICCCWRAESCSSRALFRPV